MTVTVTPTLTVAGLTISGAPGGALVAVDKLRIPWGRDSLLAQPTPATADITVRDTSAAASFASRTDLIGQPVVLGWSSSDGTSGVNFRGRVTDVEVEFDPVNRQFDVGLACSSKEVDCANYTAAKGTVWPAETFTARLARIVALLPAGFFAGGVVMPTRAAVGLADSEVADPSKDFGDYTAAQLDVSGLDVLALLRQFYNSVYPVPLVYDPALDRMTYGARRGYAYSQITTRAMSAVLIRDFDVDPAGRYLIKPQAVGGGVTLGLAADELQYAAGVSQPLDTRVTRVEVAFRDSTAAYAQATTAVATTLAGDEATTGRRTLSVDSIHATTAIAAQLATTWATVAAAEGARRRLSPLTYVSDDGTFPGPFYPLGLLAGAEGAATMFVRGTWLTRLGMRPSFGIMGGTITYSGGGWSIDVKPAPVFTAVPTVPLTIAYAAKPTVKLADIDPSVTFGDLAFVDIGAGFNAATQPPWGSG